MSRIVFGLSSLVALFASFLATGSPAFAMRVDAPGGGPSAHFAPVVHHSAGLRAWEVAVIVIAGLLLVGAATVGGAFVRVSHRAAPTPASS
jgi:hypothetical protein